MSEQKEELHKLVIRRKEEFVVAGMGRVTVMTAIDKDIAKDQLEPEALYEGFAILGIPEQGRVVQVPVEFVIENATDLEDAFRKFQPAAVARFKEIMSEAEKQAEAEHNKIITAPASILKSVR